MRNIKTTIVLCFFSLVFFFTNHPVVFGSENNYSTALTAGADQYLSITENDQEGLNLQPGFTLESWMKLTSQPPDNYIILSKYSYDPNGRSYSLSYQGGGTGLTCIVNATGESGKNYVLTSNAVIPTGEWHHLACTYAPDGVMRLFVDGENIAIADNGPVPIAINDSDFRIGAADVPSEYDNAFDGLIDEVRVWSVARTGEEIRRDMRRVLAGDEPGLEGYWRFEGDPTDRSSNHNDLAPYNAPAFSDDVPFLGEAADIRTDPTLPNGLVSYWPMEEEVGIRKDVAGNNDLTEATGIVRTSGAIGYAADLEREETDHLIAQDGGSLAIATDRTWSGWVQVESELQNLEERSIESKYDGVNGKRGIMVSYEKFEDTPRLHARLSSDGTTYSDATYAVHLVPGEWYHLAWRYHANEGIVDVFVNGVLGASLSGFPASIYPTSEPYILGYNKAFSSGGGQWDGLLDEVGLWNKALTDAEIGRLYNAGKGLPYGGVEEPLTPYATSSVAFLPGIMGSRLYEEAGGGEEKRWESVMAGDIAALRMKPDGTSMSDTLYTRDVLDTVRPVTGLGSFGEAYEGWTSFLDDLVARGGLAEWQAIPYDWRLATDEVVSTGAELGSDRVTYVGALKDAVPPILARLAALADRSPSGRVTIVAHSNGGLVAKHILRYLTEHHDPLLEKIDKVLLVASPQAGTPKAVREVLHGIEMPAQQTLQEAIAYMPGALGLLPSPHLMPLLSEPAVEVDGSVSRLSLMQDLAGTSITTYEGLRSFLTGETGVRAPHQTIGYLHPNTLSPTLLTNAAAMHGDIDTWRATSSVRVVEVVGTGLWTPRGVRYSAEDKVAASGLTLPTLRTEWLANVRGDGTVLATSAESGEADTTYYFDVARYNADKGVNNAHGTILSTAPVQTLVEDLLGGSDEVPLYMNTTGVDDPMPRFELRAYSPVDLHLTRGALHTGVVGSASTDLGRFFEERIPNSKYEEWVDVKYLAGDFSGGPLTLSLKGTGAGTFTLVYVRYGSDGGTTTLVFADVPVSKVSKGSLVLAESGTSLLHYDVDGDGVTDVRLAPNGAGGGVPAQLHFAALKLALRDTAMPAWLRAWLMTQYTFAEREYKKGKPANLFVAKGVLGQMLATIAQQTPKAIAPSDAAALQALVRALMAKL